MARSGEHSLESNPKRKIQGEQSQESNVKRASPGKHKRAIREKHSQESNGKKATPRKQQPNSQAANGSNLSYLFELPGCILFCFCITFLTTSLLHFLITCSSN
jgi:hypothetical protein